ncbi:Na+/H+ antiporter subunit E [Hydrogenophaga sp.]|uniref:Na+/H+ antiporter subunit E n=1 Tax=Hydrogenophaga sp. TaxID=1904254 RepID=UPI002638193E|nr:Na+/H+ antiporter subunit E [Hydrogenophaga sp.]MCW5652817.1 Na+/H+ antiporter subunit E [Hydrogenophaga sp.]
MRRIRALWNWLALAGIFLRELVLSVREVALTVLRPQRAARSGIVAVPLTVRSDAGIALLANMVTLTPGTTSLHVSADRRVLYAHVMNLQGDPVAQIVEGFEARVRAALGEVEGGAP